MSADFEDAQRGYATNSFPHYYSKCLSGLFKRGNFLWVLLVVKSQGEL